MPNPIQILIVEHSAADIELIHNELITAGISFTAREVQSEQAYIAALSLAPDIILSDFSLPSFDGPTAFTIRQEICPDIPFIFVSGNIGEERSIEYIKAGVTDYVLKDKMFTLVSKVNRALTEAKEKEEKKAADTALVLQSEALAISNSFLAASEKSYSDLFQLSPQPMCLYEMPSFRFVKVNAAAISHYGFSEEEFLKISLMDLVPEEEKMKAHAMIKSQQREINKTYSSQSNNIKKDGTLIEVETFSTPIIINNKEMTLVVAVDVTERKRADHTITKAIIKTQEDERYEIGGELHDNVCQILAASLMTLGVIKKSLSPEAQQKVSEGMEYISLAAEEIRKLSHRLAPVFFEESTMKEAFTKLFDTFTIDEQVRVVFDFDDSVDKFLPSVEMQLNLYRILQEQIRNILKYASATLVEVDVIVYNNRLKMRIFDNGIGFNVEKAKNGIGLNNMKRRAELFSGRFDIESSPGNGCTVFIDIPLQDSNPKPPGQVIQQCAS